MTSSQRARISAQPLFLVFAFGLLMLVVVGAAAIALLDRWRTDAELVTRTVEVTNQIANLRVLLRRAESGQRSYLLTGERAYLDAYQHATDEIPPALNDVKQATAGNEAQRTEVAAISAFVARRVEELRDGVRVYDTGGRESAAALIRSETQSLATSDGVGHFDRLLAGERAQLEARTAESDRTRLFLLTTTLAGAGLMLLLAAGSIWLVRRSDRAREDALLAYEISTARLEATVAERTAHLESAGEEVRRGAEILKNTITSMADAVLVFDENGTVVISNPAAHRLFGARADVGSEDWQRTYHLFKADGITPFAPDDTPMACAIRGENVDAVDMLLRRDRDVKTVHLVANGRPLANAVGQIKGAVLVYRDVTALQETERQLRQSQKMEAVGQLTGGIAHDFNNILTVIMGTIGILAEAVTGNQQLTAIARMIDEAAERGAELTRHLLAFARKQPLQPQSTDINELVTGVEKLLRPTLGEQVQIAAALEPDTWAALVDPSQLTTALLNLALNARDAMPDGGKLTLDTGNVVIDDAYAHTHDDLRPGYYVVVAVSDTGEGIPAAIREKVFEPFFTTKGTGKGTGLGLSMVYGFVKQSNGHIKIYSEEGHGTTVRLYLPRSGEEAGEATTGLTDPQLVGGDEKILVVEDDQLVSGYVTAQLSKLGYAVKCASTAEGAIDMLDDGLEFDLLLTDVILPGALNGRQLADVVKRRRPRAKILFTSGYTENAIIHHGRLDPGVLLLPKPYRKSELARMVRLALDGSTVRQPRDAEEAQVAVRN